MTPAQRAEFAQLLTDVLAYYRQDASRFTLELWWNACQRFELEQVRRALTAHATDPEHGQFAPKVADLVRQLAGTPEQRAALAWGQVLEAMQAVGAYQDVVFDDPATHAAVEDLGGWPKLCRTPMAELGFVQHRFGQAHRAYTARGTFDYPRRLMGDRSPDHEYLRAGLAPPAPLLVGQPERAQAVFAGGTHAGKARITAGHALLPALTDGASNHNPAHAARQAMAAKAATTHNTIHRNHLTPKELTPP
jgi:hypothetical protein